MESTPQNLPKCKQLSKTKQKNQNHNFRTNNASFGSLVFAIFQISTRKFFNMQSFMQKKKILTFITKNALFEYFQLEFGKAILIFEINALEFV